VIIIGVPGGIKRLLEQAYRSQQHVHSREYWFGISGDQSGNDWGDGTSLTPYRAISGNGDFGGDANDEAKVLGTDDTPILAGGLTVDVHRILVVGVSVDTEWRLRIVWGTGTMADAITANQVSALMVKFDSVNPQLSAGVPVDVRMPGFDVGYKVWIQAQNATNNATIDFYVGVHEYYKVEA
jgi:hypothetical protein